MTEAVNALRPKDVFADMPPCETLRSMFATGTVLDADGQCRKLNSGIGPAYAGALYRAIVRFRPSLVVEVGMAYGCSSLSILAGLDAVGHGRLISIDPSQHTDWNGIGVENVRRSGFSQRHTLMELPSCLALPQLLAGRTRVDLAYIDGWHTFDYVLTDFFYLDKLLPPGGVVAFNDCGYRAIHRVIRFVQTHRRYLELDVGLPRSYAAKNVFRSIAPAHEVFQGGPLLSEDRSLGADLELLRAVLMGRLLTSGSTPAATT